MPTVNKYRIWCNTDSKYEYEWAQSAPTACPVNGAHSIDSSKTTVIETIGSTGPLATDGKQFFSPDIFPEGTLYICGAGDHATNGRGEGAAFTDSSETSGDTTTTFSFNDRVYLAGGSVQYSGGVLGDWVSLKVYAPATSTSTADPANTGNCNLTDVGGGVNLITPAAGDGTDNVTLANAVPVPSATSTGYYDWDSPETGKGTISAGTAGAADYNLFDTQLDLAQFAAKVPLLGSGVIDLTIPAIKPKLILPHWTLEVKLHNSGHAGLKIAWDLVTARLVTTT